VAVPAWVSEVGIAAQVTIAVVAIWGERIRARLLGPDLHIQLANRTGTLETIAEQLPGQDRGAPLADRQQQRTGETAQLDARDRGGTQP